MAKYVFLGSEATIEANKQIKFDRLGVYDLDEEVADHAAANGILLLPESDCILAAADVAKYFNRPLQSRAPQAFQDDLKAEILKAIAHGESLRANSK